MKVYDKTSLQNEKGEVGILARVRGTLKYGFRWYPELEAQKLVITKLDRLLERGYVLIRNFTLPKSEIIIPLILIGPGGVQVIYVTHVKGFFEAKGNEWNTVKEGRAQPASINLISRVLRLSRAFQVYLQRQKIDLPCPVDPVLIAANPGAHLEALRPVVRVVKSDAINAFAASVLQSSPVLRTDYIHDLADHIINPRPPGEKPLQAAPQSTPQNEARAAPSRAQSNFEASKSVEPFQPSEVEFALRDEVRKLEVTPELREPSPSQRLARPDEAQPGKRAGSLNARQTLLLIVLAFVEFCVLAGFGALIYFNR